VMSGGKIYLSGGGSHGEELWVAEEGQAPRLVADIAREEGASNPANFVPYQGGLAFTAADGITFRTEVWRSDGSSAGTFPLTSTPSFAPFFPNGLTVAGSSLFFLSPALQSAGQDLWRSDGTAAGTASLVTDRLLVLPTALAGSLYFFSADIDTPRYELWKSNGTQAGTRLVATLPFQMLPAEIQAVGGELYFLVSHSSGAQELWRSDGTLAGTFKLAGDFRGSDKWRLFRLGARVYYLNGRALWSTDGTPAGTRAVTAFVDAQITDLTALDGVLYLIVRDSAGQALWRSDGSAAGTVSVVHFPVATGSYGPIQLTAGAGRLFFPLADRAHGFELWTSDGTAAGTVLVRDIFPGSGSSVPSSLTAAGGRLFFTAGDGTHGFELWQSDGTEAGTRLVQDIAPEAASSLPDRFTVAGDRLYFTADDGITGRELWSLPLAAPAGCQPSSFQLCLGGRYRVEAVWRDFQGHSGRGTGVALTADTGYFWFFDPSNVEVVVKTLDGHGFNGHGWVFYGALSNVQYDLTVTDTQTGLTRRYSNIEGRFASVGDTHAFGPLGAFDTAPGAQISASIAPPSPPPLIRERVGKAATVPCQPSARRLCLNNNRFAVEVAWKDFQNRTGTGTAVPLTSDTGTFWFFASANVELVVKALDGRPFNGKYWLFYGSLSNVEYTLTVTDTQTGTIRTYKNPSGQFASAGDTEAF
jgi:ELWxxDGT repeat protein